MIALTLNGANSNPILTKPLKQGANPNTNFGCKLTTAVFWDNFGGTLLKVLKYRSLEVFLNVFKQNKQTIQSINCSVCTV